MNEHERARNTALAAAYTEREGSRASWNTRPDPTQEHREAAKLLCSDLYGMDLPTTLDAIARAFAAREASLRRELGEARAGLAESVTRNLGFVALAKRLAEALRNMAHARVLDGNVGLYYSRCRMCDGRGPSVEQIDHADNCLLAALTPAAPDTQAERAVEHHPFCNYWGQPIGAPGCICVRFAERVLRAARSGEGAP